MINPIAIRVAAKLTAGETTPCPISIDKA